MTESFDEFIANNFTKSLFISVIVYKIFSIILDDLINPVVCYFFDPYKKLSNKKINLKEYSVNYGKSITEIVTSFIILTGFYLFSRNK